MASFHDNRNTFYVGDFDAQTEEMLGLPLILAAKQQAGLAGGHIDMFVNSYGGNAHVAFHIVEAMEMAKSAGVVVRTMVTSAAYSAGSIVAVAGTPGYRYIAKSAKHLAHYGFTEMGKNSTPREAQRNHGYEQEHFKQVLNHYKKYCDMPDLEHNLLEDAWYIKASDAKKWGMADQYLDRFLI